MPLIQAVFLSPWSRPVDRDRARKAWQVWLDRKKASGWHLVRVVREFESPTPMVNEAGDLMRECVVEVELDRSPRTITYEVPDELVLAILQKLPQARVR